MARLGLFQHFPVKTMMFLIRVAAQTGLAAFLVVAESGFVAEGKSARHVNRNIGVGELTAQMLFCMGNVWA